MTAADVNIDGYVAPGYEAVRDRFARNFERRDERGAAFCAYVGGELVVDIWGGIADHQTGQPWGADTIALGFSMTKGITATIANRFIELGLIDPHEPVASYWPEFGAAGKAEVTVAQLLSHQAGLAVIEGTFTLDEALRWTPVVDALAAQAPQWEPGSRHGYHLRSFGWLAGELLRRADPQHRHVGEMVRDEIATPLGADLWLGLPADLDGRVARLVTPDPSTFDVIPRTSTAWRAMTGPDEKFGYNDMWNSRALRAAVLPSSSAIGSARAFAQVYASLVGDGLDGQRLLTSASVDRARTALCRGRDRIIVSETAFGLGYMLPPSLPSHAGAGAFGHGGAGGSTAFADPEAGLACCYLMNRLHFDYSVADLRAETLVRALYDCI